VKVEPTIEVPDGNGPCIRLTKIETEMYRRNSQFKGFVRGVGELLKNCSRVEVVIFGYRGKVLDTVER